MYGGNDTDVMILRLRQKLGLTQEQFASLLGVHGVTVSKWETGRLFPTSYQSALMVCFEKSHGAKGGLGDEIVDALLRRGVGAALFCALRPGFLPSKKRRV